MKIDLADIVDCFFSSKSREKELQEEVDLWIKKHGELYFVLRELYHAGLSAKIYGNSEYLEKRFFDAQRKAAKALSN